MTHLKFFAFALSFTLPSMAYASLIDGFENGLDEWTFAHDVSVQNSSIGVLATEGDKMLFLSTITQSPPPGPSSFAYTPYRPYTGYQSGWKLLGLPQSETDFYRAMNTPVGMARDFGGIAKTQITVSHAGKLTFDWNKIGADYDVAFYSLWSESDNYRENGWIYGGLKPQPDYLRGNVDLCRQIFQQPGDYLHECSPPFDGNYNTEGGWKQIEVKIPNGGVYWFGVMTSTNLDSLAPSVLVLDNIQYEIPLPNTATLTLAAIFLLWHSRAKPSGKTEITKLQD